MAEIDSVFPPERLPEGLAVRDARKRMIKEARDDLWHYLQNIIKEQKKVVEERLQEIKESKREIAEANRRRRLQYAEKKDAAAARRQARKQLDNETEARQTDEKAGKATKRPKNKSQEGRRRRLNTVIKEMQRERNWKTNNEAEKVQDKQDPKTEHSGNVVAGPPSTQGADGNLSTESGPGRSYGWTDEWTDENEDIPFASRTENPNLSHGGFLPQHVADFIRNVARRLNSHPVLPGAGNLGPSAGLRPVGIGVLP